jgi:aminoglycoside phosphotransferase (APT) family kinase protein
MMSLDDTLAARTWLERCLQCSDLQLHSATEVGHGSGCCVWDCNLRAHGRDVGAILKLYAPGFDEYSELGPVDTARKHALVLAVMPALGVPTPRVLGFAQQGDEAALVIEHVKVLPWQRETRIEAARILARLHSTPLSSLSAELMDIVRRSRPNRDRVGCVPAEPREPEPVLQHGDYFSVNILQTRDGLRVIDWDLLALGDPMWDLGHLLEADRGVTDAESAAVIAAYEAVCPIAPERLAWQRECWRAFWRRRDKDG